MVSPLVVLAVSPGGRRVVTGDTHGVLRCYDVRGVLRWKRELKDVDRLATCRDARLTLAYAARQPLRPRAHFLDIQGKVLASPTLPGAIQTGIVSIDGKLAAIATQHQILFFSRNGDQFRSRALEVAGQIRQLQFGPADSLYVVTRKPHRIQLVKSTGKVLWTREARTAVDYSISASQDGKLLAAASQRPAGATAIDVLMLSSRNERLWSASSPGRAPRVRISGEGSAVILTYEHKVAYKRESRFEQRLAYLDEEGKRRWTRGGVFQIPLYGSLSNDGAWIVALDTQPRGEGPSFRLFDRNGARWWLYQCPADVLIATASADGSYIATYRADRTLELVYVNTPAGG